MYISFLNKMTVNMHLKGYKTLESLQKIVHNKKKKKIHQKGRY